VREALEAQAARLFAALSTDEELGELRLLALRLDRLVENPGTGRAPYLALHERLHHQISEGARCPALMEAIDKMRLLASPWLSFGQGRPAILPKATRRWL
jgi:DNA-binding GntR family transcriptional regulator